MHIRKACQNDFPRIREIIDACSRQLLASGIKQWDAVYPSDELISGDIDAGSTFLLETGGITAGTVSLDPGEISCDDVHAPIAWEAKDQPGCFINRLAVHPDYQRNGYASRLMDYAERYAEVKLGARSLRLDARTEYPLILEIYTRRGYRRRGNVAYDGGCQQYTVMEKYIPETTITLLLPPYDPGSSFSGELGAVLAIRKEVFIQGQHVPEGIERDGLDTSLGHILLKRGEEPAGCLRLHPTEPGLVKLERIAVLDRFRNYGYGKKLVNAAVDEAGRQSFRKVVMHAQYYLLDYYSSLGFNPVGSPFMEADIKHIEMEKLLG